MTTQPTNGRSDLEAAVQRALDDVRDPELDEPITGLGFVASCRVGPDQAVKVRLRVPTFFCPPNFVFMMVADARDAVARIAGVTSVDVAVDEHFAADDINAGVAEQRTFIATFGDLAESELDCLRIDFLRKAVLAATDRVCQPLLANGQSSAQLATLTLADPPRDANLLRLLDRRGQLGLPVDDAAPLLIDPTTGIGVTGDEVTMHLRQARLTRLSMETNGELCRSLLHRRYGETPVHIGSQRTAGTGAPHES
jgi:metal-sulfur cluster biosynthetic enzyme